EVEARIGRQAAEEADGDGQSERGRPAERQGGVHDGGDDEAAREIDDHRAVRERAAEPLRGPERDEIAGAGAHGAAQADQEEPFHAESPHDAAMIRLAARAPDWSAPSM